MADTTFSAGTIITHEWLNDVNRKTYHEQINVKTYGAVGDGINDDTTAFQNALDDVTGSGGMLYIPEGTYKISESLRIYNQLPEKSDGPLIQGAGQNKTVIDFYGSGYVFDVRGIPASDGSVTQDGTYFIWGTSFANFGVTGIHSTGTTDFCRLVGAWDNTFYQLDITKMRHGIVSNGDTTYSTNPDSMSTSYTSVIKCSFTYLTGAGVYNTLTLGLPGTEFKFNRFIFCGGGGIVLNSGSSQIIGNTFQGCGWSSSGATPTPNTSAIKFDGTTTGTSQIIIAGNEFDVCFTSHLDLVYCSGITSFSNRFIFNDSYGYGSVCPTSAAIQFAAYSSDNAVQNISFENEVFRLDDGVTSGTPTCFNFVTVPNVQNISGKHLTLSDDNSSLNLTRLLGHTASNAWLVNNFNFDFSDVANKGYVYLGRPSPEYIGSINPNITTTGGAVETIIKFTAQESLNQSVYGSTLYDSTTGKFVCPVEGYYEVEFTIAIAASLTTDYNAFRVYKNTVSVSEWGGAGNGGPRTWYTGKNKFYCLTGDTIDLREVCAVSRTITGAYSYLHIKLVK